MKDYFADKATMKLAYAIRYENSPDRYSLEDQEYIKQLEKMYLEYINNYSKLNKIFGLNNPLEIYTLFNHLLYGGYLSINKSFSKVAPGIRDILTPFSTNLLGSTILTGEGMCRHIAPMLSDILNASGCEAYVLATYYGSKFREIVDFFPKMIFFNHAITYAFMDDNVYFLDSTNRMIFRMDDGNTEVIKTYDGEKKLLIRLKGSILNNEINRFGKLCVRFYNGPYSTLELQEVNDIIFNVDKKIILGNDDIFGKFYRENSELYQEFNNIRVKIKRKD